MAVLGSFKAPGQRCFFCAVCFQKSGREIEQDALIWMGGIYYRPVYLARGLPGPCPREPVDKNGLPPHRSHFRKEGSLSLKNHGDGSCKSLKSDLLNGKGGNLLKVAWSVDGEFVMENLLYSLSSLLSFIIALFAI